MKLRELIMMEDGEAAVATTSSDIATVAYPLFVRGKNNKEKRKNARAAVGQKYVPGPNGIGTGVFENVDEAVNWKAAGIGGIAGAGLGALAAGPLGATIGGWAGASIGSGVGSNKSDANTKVTAQDIQHLAAQHIADRKAFANNFKSLANSLKDFYATDEVSMHPSEFVIVHMPHGEQEFFNWDNEDIAIEYAEDLIMSKLVKPLEIKITNGYGQPLVVFDPSGKAQIVKGNSKGVEEAHVLNHDNVIYRLDRENPMSDTEVAVLGGAGRYSLKALRDKARREAGALAQDLSVEHGGAFRRSAENIKQLTNTINTIVAAYNELARLRRKGGRGSRGITDEDANFIRECIRVVEQAAQNYRLMEGLVKEPDPKGYAKNTLTNPKYTVVVNTPGDLDWYKIGTYWNNKVVDPHEFGQDDSDTVLVAQGAEEYKEMLDKIKRMGLTYKIIGGTSDQPEIHEKNKKGYK